MFDFLIDGPLVDLQDMLQAREERAQRQYSWLTEVPGATLVSCTLNLPGPVKTSPALLAVFQKMTGHIDQALIAFPTHQKELLALPTGPEYYLLTTGKPKEVKQQLIQLEEDTPLGRLFDLDVLFLNKEIQTISRTELGAVPRKCYICEEDAKVCGRSRKHTLNEMYTAIQTILVKEQE